MYRTGSGAVFVRLVRGVGGQLIPIIVFNLLIEKMGSLNPP